VEADPEMGVQRKGVRKRRSNIKLKDYVT